MKWEYNHQNKYYMCKTSQTSKSVLYQNNFSYFTTQTLNLCGIVYEVMFRAIDSADARDQQNQSE